jgi:hypothetical protein
MTTGKAHGSDSSSNEQPPEVLVQAVESALRSQVGLSVTRLSEQAFGLTHVGTNMLEALGDTPRHATANELLKRAHQLRGLVLHGVSALVQLQAEAGRLEALAAIAERLED